MNYLYILLAALAPVLVMLIYIYFKDRNPEPIRWILRAFLYGIGSVFISLFFTSTMEIFGVVENTLGQSQSILDAFKSAFLWAAIPEESAKLLMLYLLLRKNPFFDEHMDGIVYATCVGLGFAALENILYLFGGADDGSWVSIGIGRALFSIPGHFFFAVLMGYNYSLFHFGVRRNIFTWIMIWLAPVMAHGIYDGILFSREINESFSVVCMIIFLIFFNRLRKRGKRRIEELNENDKEN